MSGDRVVVTEAGPVTLAPVARETLEALARLFPRLGFMESERGEMLALATAHEERGMTGLRTGYGWYDAKDLETAQRISLIERLRLPHALAAFARRGFHGVLFAGSCLWDSGGEYCQQGEVLFAHIEAPLGQPFTDRRLPTYEATFGEGGSDVMLGLVHDLNEAWRGGGLPQRVLSDLEPCVAHEPNLRWWADLVLVNDRFVLVRPELQDDDLVLIEAARAGITRVEFAPSSFVLVTPADSAKPAGEV
ncbi:MAG: hypothetical protein U0704_08785 [Candidatus Eisenbacteria bacterium]